MNRKNRLFALIIKGFLLTSSARFETGKSRETPMWLRVNHGYGVWLHVASWGEVL
jgi:hypothetical protein